MIPFLKGKKLSGRIELDSNLIKRSNILHRNDERVIGQDEVLESGIGKEITL